MHTSPLLALAALALPAAQAVYQGFNYGATFTDNSAKQYQNFVDEFNAAKSLAGTNGAFTSARLFTMVQAGSTADPISALKAAQDTQTSLLLGVWCSAGAEAFANEITALNAAIQQYPDLVESIAGISVGSEDLYRVSPIGIENESGPGASPSTIVDYIGQVRNALADTPWSNIPVGHVDTWTAYVNDSNAEAITACDFLGVDAYPYFQNTMPNGIENGLSLFNSAIQQTREHAQGKDVWITETGWPVSGDDSNLAIPSTDNAQTYWQQVGCPNFGSVNTWWFTLQDGAPTTPNPSFGIIGQDINSEPLYDLSCDDIPTPSSSSAAPTGSQTSVPTSGGVSSNQGGAAAGVGTSSNGTAPGAPTQGSGSNPPPSSGSGSAPAPSASVYEGAAPLIVKGSVAGVLGVVAAAVMLL